ncbi:hypothetical protein ACVWWG_006585 [Bradyrhizobium sp. LB7.2]
MTGFRQEQVPETFGARQRLQLLDNRIDLPRPEFFRLAIEALLVRIDVPVHEAFELALELDDFGRHRVEHLGLLWIDQRLRSGGRLDSNRADDRAARRCIVISWPAVTWVRADMVRCDVNGRSQAVLRRAAIEKRAGQ